MRGWRVRVVLFSVLAVVAAACGGGGEEASPADVASEGVEETSEATGGSTSEAPSEGGELSADLNGAGATFPEPVYLEWIGEYTSNVQPGVQINYQGVGSSTGREQFIGQQVDFAGTDAFAKDEEITAAEEARGSGSVLHIPMVQGGVVVAYNIPELEGLVLDAPTIAGIFLGTITNVNDPAIAALNPDVELPDQPLTVVHRADGSGTTSIFTKYLEEESEEWAAGPGSGSEIEWPTGIGGEGNDGVAQAISQQPGGIGYVNFEFAIESGLGYASVVNDDGTAIEPTVESISTAADTVEEIPDDLRFDVLNVGGEGYPIVGTTWILAYTAGYEEDTAAALQDWLTWNLEEGDSIAEELSYAPLPEGLQEQALEKVAEINSEG